MDYFSDEDAASAVAGAAQAGDPRSERMREALAGVDAKRARSRRTRTIRFSASSSRRSVDDLDFRNMLQRSRSETERLRMFADFTEEYVARKQYAAKMKRAAPLNGFGHKPARRRTENVVERLHRRRGRGPRAARAAGCFAAAARRRVLRADECPGDQAAGTVEIGIQAGNRGQGNEAGLVQVQETCRM